MRVNVGCGQSPTPGWENFDNSLSIRLARIPLVLEILSWMGLVGQSQCDFASFARLNRIRFANAARRLPLSEDSVEVLYSSHMLEHLGKVDACAFLRESFRVLRPGGVIRIVVPDLRRKVDRYLASGDADRFIESTYLCRSTPQSLIERILFLVIGPRNHQWMYDGPSLCNLLSENGFRNPLVMEPGETRIQNPGRLDLHERSGDSVYVEAIKPQGNQVYT